MVAANSTVLACSWWLAGVCVSQYYPNKACISYTAFQQFFDYVISAIQSQDIFNVQAQEQKIGLAAFFCAILICSLWLGPSGKDFIR